ncbi:MAG: SDR family oxidoreductase [Chloroflexi bacterium]|nr:MAG: SDR family oxidoreductase [Chloroflexota bacterium]
MRLQNKNAIVTGSGNGIGRAIARRFASEGAKVTVAELEEDSGRKTVELIEQAGGTAVFVETDTSDSASVKAAVAAAVAAHGEVDLLVNNAAAFVFGKVEDVTQDDWMRVFGVNVIGYANCVREVLPSMRRSSGGAIVNIASVSSFIAQPDFIPYNASKGAVAQLPRCLAMDLAKDNIRVNAVCPGAIRTRATDRHIASLGLDPDEAYRDFGQDSMLKRMGEPEEIASGVLFLASDEASFMTGAHVVIDGGASID